jgi:sulfate permease, SulP family
VLHVLKASTPRPKLMVLEASGILEIDFTAAQILRDLLRQIHAMGITIAISRLESTRAQEAFERFKLYDVLPKDRVFRSVDEAIRALAVTGGM